MHKKWNTKNLMPGRYKWMSKNQIFIIFRISDQISNFSEASINEHIQLNDFCQNSDSEMEEVKENDLEDKSSIHKENSIKEEKKENYVNEEMKEINQEAVKIQNNDSINHFRTHKNQNTVQNEVENKHQNIQQNDIHIDQKLNRSKNLQKRMRDNEANYSLNLIKNSKSINKQNDQNQRDQDIPMANQDVQMADASNAESKLNSNNHNVNQSNITKSKNNDQNKNKNHTKSKNLRNQKHLKNFDKFLNHLSKEDMNNTTHLKQKAEQEICKSNFSQASQILKQANDDRGCKYSYAIPYLRAITMISSKQNEKKYVLVFNYDI